MDMSNPGSSLCARQWDKPNFTPPYLLIQSAKPASFHTQTTKECQGKRSLNGIMAIISKIWTQSMLEHDLSLRCLMLDVVPDARARTGARPRTPRALVRASPRSRSPAPLKPPPDVPHLTTCSPSLARRPSLAPASFPSPAITARASATVASSLQPRPSCACPSVSFASGPWSFPSSRTRQNLTRDPRSSSPDFGRPWPHVDRVIRWAILKFLALTSSLISGEAPWHI
jgi:hypothetical protein